jgi:hypothetical protein
MHCRWYEAVPIYHALVRLAFRVLVSHQLITYPANYLASMKLGIDVAVDVLLEGTSQPVSERCFRCPLFSSKH